MNDNKSYEYNDTPILLLDGVVSLAPLIAAMTNSEDPEVLKEDFKNELKLIKKNHSNIDYPNVGHRIMFLLGIILKEQVDQVHSEKVAPHKIISMAIELYSELSEHNFNDLHDIPLENALWAVEVAALVDRTIADNKYLNGHKGLLLTELAAAFNNTMEIIPQIIKQDDIRSRNAVSKDIAERFNFCFSDFPEGTPLSDGITKFKDSIETYSSLIVGLCKAQAQLLGS
ncbi:hypothetical protein V6259_18870 [Marinomonas sp. TI.3.20]|uniref:hypothetical protein n=1 Tax=Marinomonas sp. TI.3.20 TaxID=3121296 RepID=UPI00311D99BA